MNRELVMGYSAPIPLGLETQLVSQLSAMLDARMAAVVPAVAGESRLRRAMRHAVVSPGKRARGLITMLVAASWGQAPERALEAAAAIELVHAASLVLDDLPAMDDTDVRRGAPACHVEFGEGAAILAAIALLSEAHLTVTRDIALSDGQRIALVDMLSRAVGVEGMAGGQDADLDPPSAPLSVAAVEEVHAAKTGALFEAAALAGTIVAGIDGPRSALMADFGLRLGLAFQALDDLADHVTDRQASSGSNGVVAVLGQAGARRRADEQARLAFECLEASGAETTHLARYVDSLIELMRAKASRS